MNYQGTLESGEQIAIGNHDSQTKVLVQSKDSGHSESQGTSFETGKWKTKPHLFQTSNGAVIQIETEGETIILELRDGSLQRLDEAPELKDATEIELEKLDEFPSEKPLKPMAPMKPMEPLKPMKPMS